MKRIAVAAFLLAALGMLVPSQQAGAQVSISVQIGGFYDGLSPYGEWIDCSYGECWAPRGVDAGWQPYSNGEWIYTRYGWTWVSNDPWGGDPYHYGTWAFVGGYGWVWVPGTVWAPAWVTWSYSDRYVGWAPMPPTVTFGSSGYSGRAVVVSEAQYVFVPTDRFVGTSVTSVRVEPRRNAEIFRQAKPATRFEVSGGVVRNVALPMAIVQRATSSKIETREISTARTTPRTLAAGGVGKRGHVAIVAPAREVKAARASRQAAPGAAPREQTGGRPASAAKAKQQEQKQQVRQQEQKKQERKQQQLQPPPRAEAPARTRPEPAPAAQPARPEQTREKAAPARKEPGKDPGKEKKNDKGGGKPPR